MPETTVILDAVAIQRALTRIGHEIAERNEVSADVVLARLKQTWNEQENGDDDAGKNKIANLLRRAEPIRVARFAFIFPSRPRGAALKEHGFSLRRSGGFCASLRGA